MDGELIQKKIYGGLQKAALRVGLTHDLYRPTAATDPLSSGNLIGTVLATYAPKGSWYRFGASTLDSSWVHLLVDGEAVNVGDYLKRGADTYFVADKPHIGPILGVKCNAVMDLRRAATPNAAGLNGYGGMIEATEAALATGWPTGVTYGGRSQTSSPLPSGQGTPGASVYVPAIPGILILPDDILRDALGFRYGVCAALREEYGWSVSANLLVT